MTVLVLIVNMPSAIANIDVVKPVLFFNPRTPAGLFSPEFSVEDAREGFEVRRYASYAVCSATMAGKQTIASCGC